MRGLLQVPAALCASFALAASAYAAASPAQTCQASQLRAAARFFQTDLRCQANFYKAGAADAELPPLDDCRTGAAESFTSAWDAAVEEAGGAVCTLEDPGSSIAAGLQDSTEGLVTAVSGGFADTGKAERSLHASLLGAVGSGLSGGLNIESKDAKKGDEASRLAGREKARGKLLSSFDKALAKAAGAGVAYAGDDATTVANAVDAIVNSLAADTTPLFLDLSGVVQATAGSAIDSDTNDPNAPPVSNDSSGTAQEVAVPAAIGGYVNLPGFGPPGSSQANGDSQDFYRVSLTTGQRVNLRFGDPVLSDLDLCLFTGGGILLDCSEGITNTEELFAPSSGEFLVRVFVFAFPGCECASSYVLTLGQSLASTGPDGVRVTDEFVPGELIVKLDPKAAALAAGPPAAALAASFGMTAAGGAADREMLFRLPASEAARGAALATLGAAPASDATAQRRAALSPDERAKHDTILAMKGLRRQPGVALVEPNWIRRAQLTPDDTHFALQWHYPLINLPGAWDLETGSDAVEVAVIDTGALFSHPDLDDGQLSTAFDFDFVSSSSQSLDGGGIDADATDPGDGAGVQPSSFHGTHVAGTIGASTNNASGVAGVAWDVTIVPLRALGKFGSGTSFDILQAVRYAAGLANDSGTSHLVDIINLSLGGTGSSQAEQDVYTLARNAGVIIIAAAGNNNSSQLFFPASYNGVVSVSAVETRRQKAPYSNFGTQVDVAAPGGDTSVDRTGDGYVDGVLSTLFDEQTQSFVFAFYQGTSMAAPHVAGVAALMEAADPGLTPAEFDALLGSGALTNDLGTAGRDDVFGHGLIDARKAVEAAGASGSEDPLLLVNPSSLNFGATLTTATFQVSNGGGGTLTVTSVSEAEPWLSVSPSSGLGTYTVTVDRSGLGDGTYTGEIDVTSTQAGSATVTVVMSVSANAADADAGYHYILVVNPDTFDTVAEFSAAAASGEYPYALDDVPSGTYLLFAGSDTDNDLFICGTGEACGAYPTLGRPELIQITTGRSDLDFVSGFLQTIETVAPSEAAPALPQRGFRRLAPRRVGP
jgi:serine protease